MMDISVELSVFNNIKYYDKASQILYRWEGNDFCNSFNK